MSAEQKRAVCPPRAWSLLVRFCVEDITYSMFAF